MIHPRRLIDQPLLGLVTSAVAGGLLIVSWMVALPVLSVQRWREIAVISVALVAAQYLAFLFPVHVRYTVKIEMGTVPLYLAAALLPVPVAGATAAAGVMITQILSRASRGSTVGDMATQTGRWTCLVLAGAALGHLVTPGISVQYLLLLLAVALLLLAGDILTGALQLSAINGESIPQLVAECTRGVGIAEACQYVFGVTGSILALTSVWNAALLVVPLMLVHRVAKRSNELHEGTRVLLESLADQVDCKDHFTREHSKRVTGWTREILRELGIYGPEAQLIATAARLHDIGKIAVPDRILHKHDRLTSDEWAVMEQHPVLGADTVARYPAFARGASIIRHHHERIDGEGYPHRLSNSAIPFGARVIAVADAFDAMVSDRPYRAGMSGERAAAILSGGRGTQWDAMIVDAFLRVLAAQSAIAPHPDAAALELLARTV